MRTPTKGESGIASWSHLLNVKNKFLFSPTVSCKLNLWAGEQPSSASCSLCRSRAWKSCGTLPAIDKCSKGKLPISNSLRVWIAKKCARMIETPSPCRSLSFSFSLSHRPGTKDGCYSHCEHVIVDVCVHIHMIAFTVYTRIFNCCSFYTGVCACKCQLLILILLSHLTE